MFISDILPVPNELAYKYINVCTISYHIQQTRSFYDTRLLKKIVFLVSRSISLLSYGRLFRISTHIFFCVHSTCCAEEIVMSWGDFVFENGISLRSNIFLFLFQLQALSLNCGCVYSYDIHINYSTNIKRARTTRLN